MRHSTASLYLVSHIPPNLPQGDTVQHMVWVTCNGALISKTHTRGISVAAAITTAVKTSSRWVERCRLQQEVQLSFPDRVETSIRSVSLCPCVCVYVCVCVLLFLSGLASPNMPRTLGCWSLEYCIYHHFPYLSVYHATYSRLAVSPSSLLRRVTTPQ